MSHVRNAKTREQLEIELLAELHLRHNQSIAATGQDQIKARNEFILALCAFNNLILNGKEPAK